MSSDWRIADASSGVPIRNVNRLTLHRERLPYMRYPLLTAHSSLLTARSEVQPR